MIRNAWLGIDLGTQSVKVIILDDFGRPLAKSNLPLESFRDGAAHEQSPLAWREQTFQCLKMAMASLPQGYKVQAISTAATSGTLTTVNKKTLELGNSGVMYDDSRGAAYTSEIQRQGQKFWAQLGYKIQDSWALPQMLWWINTKPLDSNEIFITQADSIHWALAGQPLASDSSHTLKSGFDLERMTWPKEIFSTIGLSVSHLNDVVAPGVPIGTVSSSAAEKTGLDAGTLIVSGMTDGSAAQIAAGAVSLGSWNSVLGTTLVLKGASTSRHHDPSGSIYCHRAPFEGGWWPGGASNTGTRAIKSAMSGSTTRVLDFDRADLESAPVEYPLTGKGERFPFVAADAEGFILNKAPVESDSQRNRFASLALGVAMIERLSFDVVSFAGYEITGPIRFTGGGSNNHSWNQLRSTMLNRGVMVPDEAGSAAGAAILARAAAEGAQRHNFDEIVNQMVTIRAEIEPDRELFGVMRDKYKNLVAELLRRGWISHDLDAYVGRNLD